METLSFLGWVERWGRAEYGTNSNGQLIGTILVCISYVLISFLFSHLSIFFICVHSIYEAFS